MSLAVFPFKSEPAKVVAANIAVAAGHHAIDEVWAIASDEGETESEVRRLADAIGATTGKPIQVLIQERIGELRPGKGDAMNTAIRRAAAAGRERVHFYDADITNFDSSWIEGAEHAADRGNGVVRHRFPRAATDAMITWFVTRPALARLFPGTFLPRINQPLGGELLITAPVLEALAGSELVVRRSDWGIDTVLTYATSVMGLGLHEHHVADGKRHALYGSLDELREMMLECLDAAASLAGLPGPGPGARHGSDLPTEVPSDLKQTVAYDVEGTTRLAEAPWSARERDLASGLPSGVVGALESGVDGFSWMDALVWFEVHGFLLDNFVLGDPDWESLAFRLWLARVLAYTGDQALTGYDDAMGYLEETITRYEGLVLNPPGRGLSLGG